LYPRAQIQQRGSENSGKGRRREKKKRGKRKVEGMTEGRGGRKAWEIRMVDGGGGIAPLLLGGIDATEDRRTPAYPI